LSVAFLSSLGKIKTGRLKPTRRDGLFIQYQLKIKATGFSDIACKLNVTAPLVFNVVFGRRRSARVEAEIVRILEKNDWNEVVMEARSAVSGKSAATLAAEEKRRLKARDAAQMAALQQAVSSGKRRAG
jgi:hypothetical protein